jgi:hypothetical protein
VVRIGFESSGAGAENEKVQEVKVQGELKMVWLWVEGWRARLRAGGDLIEKCRYDCGE